MNIITVIFQNQKARFAVQMKEVDAIEMIKNTPMLSATLGDAKDGLPICLADEIFRELGIPQPETTQP